MIIRTHHLTNQESLRAWLNMPLWWSSIPSCHSGKQLWFWSKLLRYWLFWSEVKCVCCGMLCVAIEWVSGLLSGIMKESIQKEQNDLRKKQIKSSKRLKQITSLHYQSPVPEEKTIALSLTIALKIGNLLPFQMSKSEIIHLTSIVSADHYEARNQIVKSHTARVNSIMYICEIAPRSLWLHFG